MAGEKSVRGGNLVRVGLESARLDIDGDELALILCIEMRVDVALVDLIASPGKLFFAVSRGRGSAHDTILRHCAPAVIL